jgi:phosphatidylglycerophosphate synthase
MTPTIQELREKTQAKREDFIYQWMDWLAYYPAQLLINLPITANQITIAWIIGEIIAALFLLTGNYITMVIAVLAFQILFILDCTDGIIARYRKEFSLNGVYLDYLGHYICNPLLLICYGIGVSIAQDNLLFVLAGLIAALTFLLNKAISINPAWYSNPEQRTKVEATLKKSILKNQTGILYAIFAFMRLEYFFNFMFWGTLLGYAHIVILIYALFFTLELLRKIVTQFLHNYRAEAK